MIKPASFIFVVSLIFTGCAALNSSTGTSDASKKTKYSEDLAAYRPPVPEQSPDSTRNVNTNTVSDTLGSNTVNEKLNSVLDSIAVLQVKENRFRGYTVLVHTGTNREQATVIKGELLTVVPDIKSEMIYQQPYFKVRIGKFQNQIQANSLLNKLKEEFPAAIVVPDTFPVSDEDEDE